MRFGELPIDEALGAVLAHKVDGHSRSLKKGHRLTQVDIDDLRASGVSCVLGALLDANDIEEDHAAAAVANALQGDCLRVADAFTGRANIFATHDGVVDFVSGALHTLNAIDERITIATLPRFEAVVAGQMVATIKIIPFSVPHDILAKALDAAALCRLRLAPYRAETAALIQTSLPGTQAKVLDKTVRVTSQRLQPLGMELALDRRCDHALKTLATEIRKVMATNPDMLLIAGASAITDRGDVLPRAIEDAGGRVDYFGMPVDPGNLLLLAHIGETPVLGMPGCARSPKLNGFDWVLQRLAAGIDIKPADIQRMGVGGLLSEIPSRPQPRHAPEPSRRVPRIAGLVLAAGQSRRMGTRNKLLIELRGKTLVRHAIDALKDASLRDIVVVSGHQRQELELAVAGCGARIVHNPDYASGLASSLKTGIDALPAGIDGVVVALGDMPLVNGALIRRLVKAFDPENSRSIIVPTFNGKRGNPVLWAARYLAEMRGLEGDVGAKHLIGLYAEQLFELACDDGASLLDLDTPEALAAFEAAQ